MLRIIRFAALFAVALLGVLSGTASAQVQVAGLPDTLSGRWVTLNGRYSNVWTVSQIHTKPVLEYWSSGSGGRCNIPAGTPVNIDFDGVTLKIVAIMPTERYKVCGVEFSATLTKQSDGSFDGRIDKDFNEPVMKGWLKDPNNR